MSQLWCSPNLVCPLSPCRVITFIQGSSTFQDQDFSSQVLCVHTNITPSSHFLFWLMGTPSAFPRAVPLKYKLVWRETVLGGHGKLRNTGLNFSKHLFWNSFLQRGYGKCITMLYSNHRFWPIPECVVSSKPFLDCSLFVDHPQQVNSRKSRRRAFFHCSCAHRRQQRGTSRSPGIRGPEVHTKADDSQ